MSELKQIMPADGWYAKVDRTPGTTTYTRLIAMGLFKCKEDTFVDGIIAILPNVPVSGTHGDIVYLPKETREEWTEESNKV